MDDNDMSYAGSESSSIDERAANLSLYMKNMDTILPARSKYKVVTIKGRFGKKKRKRIFQVK